MAKSYQDFYNTHLGKAYDIDGYYGAQCWDGYAEYCKYLGYPFAYCTSSGYVKDIWNNRKSNGILKYFNEVTVMKQGDVATFKEVAGWTPYSHIAMFHSDAGNGYGWFFGQNQGGANGAFNLVKLPYSATHDTAFRPKCLAGSTPTPTPTPSKEEWYDGACYVGATVKSVSCAIQGVSGNCVRVNALGGLIPLAHVTEASDSKDGNAKDDYLKNTNARVYLSPCTVQAIDARNNLVMVHGYWVNPTPLRIKK